MVSQFRKIFLEMTARPRRTVIYSLCLALTALPLVQRFAGMPWDQCVIALLVPMSLVYVAIRLCFRSLTREQQEQMERDHAKVKADVQPIPTDIGFALVLLVLMLALELVLLPSVFVYWLLAVPFTHSALLFSWLVARTAVLVIAYIGASLCWRWCLPLLRYELYSLIATVFGLSTAHRPRRHLFSRVH
jgi:hypothetical protein